MEGSAYPMQAGGRNFSIRIRSVKFKSESGKIVGEQIVHYFIENGKRVPAALLAVTNYKWMRVA